MYVSIINAIVRVACSRAKNSRTNQKNWKTYTVKDTSHWTGTIISWNTINTKLCIFVKHISFITLVIQVKPTWIHFATYTLSTNYTAFDLFFFFWFCTKCKYNIRLDCENCRCVNSILSNILPESTFVVIRDHERYVVCGLYVLYVFFYKWTIATVMGKLQTFIIFWKCCFWLIR